MIGSGALGRRLMDRFLARYPASPAAWVYHSRRPAVTQQDQDRVSVHAFDQLDSLIPRAGVILCALSAPEPVLTTRQATLFKAGPPVHVVDLGVPRNVASDLPAAAPGLRLTGLNDFKKRDSESASSRADLLPAGTRIVLEHRALYEKLMRGIRHTP
jgi:glutamyl-tRNA reductase